jgi:predicted secreted Zn-dependent protease
MEIALHRRVAHVLLPLVLLSGSGAARSEVVLVENAAGYTLDALQPKAFRKQLAHHLEQREPGSASRTHGLTDADMEVQYRLTPQPGGACLLDAVQVTLTLQLDLPRWEPAEPPDEAMQEGATATLHALQEHGHRHRGNAIRAAEQIDAALRALPRTADCGRARRDADLVIRQGRARLRAEDVAYDQSAAFRNNARATLDIATATATAPVHLPAPPRKETNSRHTLHTICRRCPGAK